MAKVIDITGRLKSKREQEIIVKVYMAIIAREYPSVERGTN